MPYTMEDFRRELAEEYLEKLTPEERRVYLQQLTPEERLRGLTLGEILQSFSDDQIKDYLAKKRDADQTPTKPKKPKRRPR